MRRILQQTQTKIRRSPNDYAEYSGPVALSIEFREDEIDRFLHTQERGGARESRKPFSIDTERNNDRSAFRPKRFLSPLEEKFLLPLKEEDGQGT